jgi:hypothetical protein
LAGTIFVGFGQSKFTRHTAEVLWRRLILRSAPS